MYYNNKLNIFNYIINYILKHFNGRKKATWSSKRQKRADGITAASTIRSVSLCPGRSRLTSAVPSAEATWWKKEIS